MGFRAGAYAKVWEVIPDTNTRTRLRVSISRKDKRTGTYETDFSGYIECIGTVAATRALAIEAGARIKLGDTDVSNYYDKEKGTLYTHYKIFSFETPDQDDGATAHTAPDATQPTVDEGEVDENTLPF